MTACGDGVADIGALCFPPDEALRVGYGFAPTAMLAADFDGDGAEDIAAASPSRQTLTIAWGPGRETATSWAIGEEIAGLAHGDVDGDGRLDLITALPGSDAVAVVRGRGGRRFERAADVAVGDSPRAVIVAQLDDDAEAEVLTADVGDGRVSVVGGAMKSVVVGDGPHALATGDVDGDGRMDVAVALADSATVQVLHGDGNGGLLAGERGGVGAGPLAIVMADFDGDGKDEIATADALDDTVSVIDGEVVVRWAVPAKPTGLVVVRDETLPALGVLSEGTSVVSLVDPRTGASATTLVTGTALAAGDGGLVLGTPGATVAVRRGEGDGLALREVWSVDGYFFGALTAIDADGDGRDEVLVDDNPLAGLQLVDGADGSAIGGRIEVPGFLDVQALVPLEVNGDGRVDIVVTGSSVGSAVMSLLQQDDGTFVPAGELVRLDGDKAKVAAGADFTGDGAVDLVVDVEGSGLWGLRGDGAGGWTAEGMASEIGEVKAMTPVGLLGGDSPDLVILADGGQWLYVWVDPMQADGLVLSEYLGEAWRDVAVASFSGDRFDAVLCGEQGLVRMRGVEDPSVYAAELVTRAPCARVIVRDGDGDGDVDVFTFGEDRFVEPGIFVDEEPEPSGVGAVMMLANDGAGELAVVSRQAAPRGWYGFTFAELDGAPAPDLVTTDGTTTGLLGRFAPALLAAAPTSVGSEEEGIFADMNGDGVLDRVQVGQGIAMALATGAGGFGPWQHASLAALSDWDVAEVIDVAVGDVDGDEADEVVVLAYVGNVSFSLRAVTVIGLDEAGRFEGGTVTRLGSLASQVLVGDLDGDEVDEVVVVDPHGDDGPRLTLLRAADGYAAIMQMVEVGEYDVLQFGLADMRGDGILDLLLQVEDGDLETGMTRLLVARGQGDGGFGGATRWGEFADQTALYLRDVDGDRAVDALVVRTYATFGPDPIARTLTLVRGGADGQAAGLPTRVLADIDAVTTADLDGDGTIEVIVGYAGEADWPVTLAIGQAVGSGSYVFTLQRLPESGAGAEVQELVAHDWDGDGRPDVAAVDETGFTIVRQRP